MRFEQGFLLFFAVTRSIMVTGPLLAEDFPVDSRGGFSLPDAGGRDPLAVSGEITSAEIHGLDKDAMEIGGALRSRFERTERDDSANHLQNPNRLSLYLDSRLQNNIRVYINGTLRHDPTIEKDPRANSAANQATNGNLDEMKIMFPIQNTLFLTIGRQKIKWGSAQFWNPTDLVNTDVRDPLRTDDERSGIDMVKAHLPLGSANLYLISLLRGANEPDKVGGAIRAEIPLGTAELALSALGRKEENSTYGIDLSFALWDFDMYAESVTSRGSSRPRFRSSMSPIAMPPIVEAYVDQKKYRTNTTVGLSYQNTYADNDTFTLFLEYFNNEDGYAARDYAAVLQTAAYRPFHLAKNYAMFALLLPAPGGLNDYDFALYNLSNTSDRSHTGKFVASNTSLRDLRVQADLSYYYGDSRGELRLARNIWSVGVELNVVF